MIVQITDLDHFLISLRTYRSEYGLGEVKVVYGYEVIKTFQSYIIFCRITSRLSDFEVLVCRVLFSCGS